MRNPPFLPGCRCTGFIRLASAAILLMSAWGGPALAAKAWLYSTEEEKVWCGFPTEAKAKAALRSGRFDGGQGVELTYHGGTIDRLAETLQSEDSTTEDQYSLDGDRVVQVARRGWYVNDPPLRVTLIPDHDGKFTLTPASRLERAKRDKAGQETYWVDWPLYPMLSKFPFATLIKTRPVIVVLNACQRLHWNKERFTPVGKPR